VSASDSEPAILPPHGALLLTCRNSNKKSLPRQTILQQQAGVVQQTEKLYVNPLLVFSTQLIHIMKEMEFDYGGIVRCTH
jgi:hypothetical protein